jgi:hypothetical protein
VSGAGSVIPTIDLTNERGEWGKFRFVRAPLLIRNLLESLHTLRHRRRDNRRCRLFCIVLRELISALLRETLEASIAISS